LEGELFYRYDMNESEIEQLVLQHVGRPRYEPAKARILARNLNLPKDEHDLLRQVIKRLIKEGRLSYTAGHRVQGGSGTGSPATASAHSGELVGVFQRKSAGFGFVRPPYAKPGSRDDDVFIPARQTKGATTGDTVRVKVSVSRRGRENRQSGEIVEILERGTHQFVGTYFEEDAKGYVRVDAGVFEQPVLVGDPGAKNAQPEDKVVIEVVRFPTSYRAGEAVITDVLGPRGTPGVDTQMIIYEFGLPGEFPEDALEDARLQAEAFEESITDGRLDLTAATIITVDPVDARDFDDAISLERLENGHWKLGVHIADVSHFVRPKSALDREAKERATSIYLPDRVIPMLPEIISNNLASLQPDRVRYTKTAFIEYTEDGALVDTEFHTAAIKSKRRFTYEEVDDYLEKAVQWKDRLTPEVFTLLDWMHKLSRILRERRMARGSLELSLPEVKLKLDKHGRVVGAHQVENTESHQMIEEFMLAANEAVATKLQDMELNFLRRVHESPETRKLRSLTEFVKELGIEAESLESRFEIKRVLAEAEGRPEQHALNYAVLRSMPKATYGPQEEGHYALASDTYCHFTSPIRRYPDLTVHRMLESIFRGKRPQDDFDLLANLGEHCSLREQRAERAERELIKLKLLGYMEKRIGHTMRAVVTGVEDFGMFAQGVEIPAEGLIHVTNLPQDRYSYDAKAHTLSGHRAGNQFRLGDLLLVEIARVDLNERTLDLKLVEKLPREGGPKAEGHATRSSRKPKPSPGKKTRSAGKTKAAGKKSSVKKAATKKQVKKKSGNKKKSSRRK
jgi:ribonuclease R